MAAASARADVERRARAVWIEVIERRKAWHTESQPDSMEDWAAHDEAWVGRLDDCLTVVVDAVHGQSDVDPRAALIDVLAVASAWIDQMG